MRQCLAVLNVGDFLRPVFRENLKAAAARWGMEWVEVVRTQGEGLSVYWQKLLVQRELQDFDQVVQVDTDVLVADWCPDPTGFVAQDVFGAVASSQGARFLPNLGPHEEKWKERTGWVEEAVPFERHLNGGMFIYSPRHHSHLFEKAWSWLEAKGFPRELGSKGATPEESLLGQQLWAGRSKGLKQKWLHPVLFAHTEGARPTFGTKRDDVPDPATNKKSPKGGMIHLIHGSPSDKEEKARSYDMNSLPHQYRGQAINDRWSGKGPVTEVGVQWGRNPVWLFLQRGGDSDHLFTMVDPWSVGYCQWKTKNEILDGRQQWWDWKLEEIKGLLPGARYLRGASHEMASGVEDGSQEMVFLDGDHSYEGVKRDIELYAPKVRRGGWLCGHDFRMRAGSGWGVERAVREWAGGEGLRVEEDVDDTWFVRMS